MEYCLNEDVTKIIETFAKREAIEKYSYVASLDEIRENDHNLNIHRYVDTFDEEEEIDIAAVHSRIKAIDEEMAEDL